MKVKKGFMFVLTRYYYGEIQGSRSSSNLEELINLGDEWHKSYGYEDIDLVEKRLIRKWDGE